MLDGEYSQTPTRLDKFFALGSKEPVLFNERKVITDSNRDRKVLQTPGIN